MIIGVDIDDVLADNVPKLCAWHNRVYGTDFNKDNLVITKNQFMLGDIKKRKGKLCQFFKNPEFTEMKPIAGAIRAISAISKTHKLILITARPKNTYDNTKLWINMYFPNMFTDMHYNDDWEKSSVHGNKLEIGKNANIDLLIDDAIKTVYEFATNGIPTLLFDQPWNQTDEPLPDKVIRVKNWKEIVENIESMQ
jgi:uncharacterized HAD superfamily protein